LARPAYRKTGFVLTRT